MRDQSSFLKMRVQSSRREAWMREEPGLWLCERRILTRHPNRGAWKPQELRWWLSGTESACQCTGSIPGPGRFHMPQSNWARVPQLLSLCSRAGKPQLLKPARPRAHTRQEEKPPQWEAQAPQLGSSPCLLQLQKSLHSNEDPVQSEINT